MKLFGKKIYPITRLNLGLFQVDVRWFFVWIDNFERYTYRKRKRAEDLKIKSSVHRRSK